jgi:hypothetical protein
MKLSELIQSIHALETRLQLFEEKYELRSEIVSSKKGSWSKVPTL